MRLWMRLLMVLNLGRQLGGGLDQARGTRRDPEQAASETRKAEGSRRALAIEPMRAADCIRGCAAATEDMRSSL